MEASQSERRWVLIGILIGFYGNWYFNLLSKIGEATDMSILLVWGISFLSLFAYCTELWTLKKTVLFNWLRLNLVLAMVHLITVGILWIQVFESSTPQSAGLFLWLLISLNEVRIAYSR